MEGFHFNKTTGIYFAVGLIIGFLVGWLGTGDRESNKKYFEDTNAKTVIEEAVEEKVSVGMTAKDISVIVADQKSGVSVTISEVNVPTTSWIAVREDNNGELSWILGARKIVSGVHKNLALPLQRTTMPDRLYHVVVYEDDGDGMFDYKSDTLVSNSNGSFFTEDFMTIK